MRHAKCAGAGQTVDRGRPTSTASAPRAMALSTSVPRRIPPSTSKGRRCPMASAIAGSAGPWRPRCRAPGRRDSRRSIRPRLRPRRGGHRRGGGCLQQNRQTGVLLQPGEFVPVRRELHEAAAQPAAACARAGRQGGEIDRRNAGWQRKPARRSRSRAPLQGASTVSTRAS